MLPSICVKVILISMLTGPGDDFFQFSPTEKLQATISVDTSRATRPISRRLFGKFTEHLGRNIYHGMWAQVLRNPGFEDWPYFFANEKKMNQARKQTEDYGKPWPKGLAAHWLPEGSGEVTYKLDTDCINSKSSQH
ncbi:MAG: hypothetical protein JSV03_03580, partial [Planctomycetota bacterium]